MKYGERIKELIKNKNITQVQLADIMGVKPSYINQLISGFRKPGRDTLKNLPTLLMFLSLFFLKNSQSHTKKRLKKRPSTTAPMSNATSICSLTSCVAGTSKILRPSSPI